MNIFQKNRAVKFWLANPHLTVEEFQDWFFDYLRDLDNKIELKKTAILTNILMRIRADVHKKSDTLNVSGQLTQLIEDINTDNKKWHMS